MIFPAPSPLSGLALSGGVLLAVAGVGKLYAGVRGLDSDSAIRRALGVGPGAWRRVEVGAAALECLTGAAVVAGLAPRAAGVALAGQGVVFSALLAHARLVGAKGGCGCMGWRRAGAGSVTWRSLARALWVLAAGLIQLATPWPGPAALARPGALAGAVAGGILVVLLGAGVPRTPRCHRRLWRPLGETLRALREHPVYAAMAAAAGPFGTAVGYRREGCADELWFPVVSGPGDGPHTVCFRVAHGPDGALTVHAVVRNELPAPASRRAARSPGAAQGPLARAQGPIGPRPGVGQRGSIESMQGGDSR